MEDAAHQSIAGSENMPPCRLPKALCRPEDIRGTAKGVRKARAIRQLRGRPLGRQGPGVMKDLQFGACKSFYIAFCSLKKRDVTVKKCDASLLMCHAALCVQYPALYICT